MKILSNFQKNRFKTIECIKTDNISSISCLMAINNDKLITGHSDGLLKIWDIST